MIEELIKLFPPTYISPPPRVSFPHLLDFQPRLLLTFLIPLPPSTPPYSILNASTTTLDHILEHPSCDVDLQSYLGKETPLHLAVKLEEGGREGLKEYLGGLRLWSVD